MKPSILVSFAFRKEWARVCHLDYWREVALDSGAFTAWKGGASVDIVELAEWIKSERARSSLVTEAFTLDVIGGTWQESLRNTEYLWKNGVECMPVFHVGEPTDVLKALVRDYPKVALGGAVGYRKKDAWARICFREVWPAKLHGLGFGAETVMELPFHSVDNSSWSLGPKAFGIYPSRNYETLPTRNTRSLWLYHELEYQLRRERDARSLWRGRMPADFGDAPSIRLATNLKESEIRSFIPHQLPFTTKLDNFPLLGDTDAR